MRHEILRPLGHPGEITHAQLIRARESRRKGQARRVGERSRLVGKDGRAGGIQTPPPQPLGLVEVEAKEVTSVTIHALILTPVVALCAEAPAVGTPASASPSPPRVAATGSCSRCESMSTERIALLRRSPPT